MTEALSRIIAVIKTLTPAEQEELRDLMNDLLGEGTSTSPANENVLHELLAIADDVGIPNLAEQHDHYLYGVTKR